jgi:hypothetical protein
MTAKLHRLILDATDEQRRFGRTMCGDLRPRHITEVAGEVTCKRCAREMRSVKVAIPALTTEDRAAAIGEAMNAAIPIRRGTHLLTDAMARIVERSTVGDDEHRKRWTWPSAAIAIATLEAFRVDGQPLRSSSRWVRRFIQEGSRKPEDAAATALIDRLVHVQQAVDRAYTVTRTFDASTDADGKERRAAILTVPMQQAILRRSIAGGAGFTGMSHAAVGEWAEAQLRVDLTDRQIEIVRNFGLRMVAEWLRSIGELEPAEEQPRREREEGTRVPLPGMDVEGWGEISGVVGLSVSTCQKLANRQDDPLPRYCFNGVAGVWAKRAELEDWCRRQISRAS